jgi:hypothetical protein
MVVAFMGRAALNVGGQTILSAFRAGYRLPGSRFRHYCRPPPHLAALELLIIDEISMGVIEQNWFHMRRFPRA